VQGPGIALQTPCLAAALLTLKAEMVCGAKRIWSHLVPAEIQISNLEIRNKFKAPISNVQNCHARVSVT
jgi:hypothetical protein